VNDINDPPLDAEQMMRVAREPTHSSWHRCDVRRSAKREGEASQPELDKRKPNPAALSAGIAVLFVAGLFSSPQNTPAG
jgi:hypothetical protein